MGTCRSTKVVPLFAAETSTIGKDREAVCYKDVAVNLIRRLYSFLQGNAISEFFRRGFPLPHRGGISRIWLYRNRLSVSVAVYGQASRVRAGLQSRSTTATTTSPCRRGCSGS